MRIKSVIFLLFFICLPIFAAGKPTNAWENLLSDELFQFTWFLADGSKLLDDFNDALAPIRKAALIVGGLLWILQLAKEVYGGVLGDNGWKEKFFYSVLKLGIISALISSGAYVVLMRDVIGGIPEKIADDFSQMYMVDFWENQGKLFETYAKVKGDSGHFLSAKFVNGLLSQILAAGVYAVMSAITLIMPMLQKCLFQMCCYIGPFAFVFILCDWTKGIFDRWLSAALAISWLSVIQAIIMYVFVTNVVVSATTSAIDNDVISTLITGLVSIAMMISSPAIAMYLFNAGGLGLEKAGGASAIAGMASVGAKAALPAVGAGVGKLKSSGYNEDGSKKAGAGAAVARTAHTLGTLAVRGSARPGSTSGEIAKHLADGKSIASSNTDGAASGGGNSKLGGTSSVPSVGNVDNSATARTSASSNTNTNKTSSNANTSSSQSGTNSSQRSTGSSTGTSAGNAGGATADGDSKLGKKSSVPSTGKQNGNASPQNSKTTSTRGDAPAGGSKTAEKTYKNPFTQSDGSNADNAKTAYTRAGTETHNTNIETGNADSGISQSSIPQSGKEYKSDDSKGEENKGESK